MVSWLSVPSWSTFGMAVGAIYAFFFLLGLGLASYASMMKCQKTATAAQSVDAALFSLYPTLAYALAAAVGKFRVHFDRVYRSLDTSEAGITRAGWISIAYIMLLATLAGVMNLVDNATRVACVSSAQEAATFRQKLLQETAQRNAKVDPPSSATSTSST
jgi:hypothetical protein